MSWRPVKGGDAEDLAQSWCQRQGWQVVERNYRARGGEIDLVCLDGDTLVFVEVRQRLSDRYGGAAASITSSKQRKLVHAAQLFLQHYRQHANRPARFDVITLGRGDELNWIKSAFTAG